MKITFSRLAIPPTVMAPAELTTPKRKFTPSFWMYRLDREESSCTLALESAMSSSNFFPSTPPFALISLTASSAPCLQVIPRSAALPERGSIPPSLIVSAAKPLVANRRANPSTSTVFLIASPPFSSRVSLFSPHRPRGNDNRLAFEHHFVPLVDALRPEPEPLLGDHLHDFRPRRDLVPDFHRGEKRKGLRQVEASGPRELHPDHRGDQTRG